MGRRGYDVPPSYGLFVSVRLCKNTAFLVWVCCCCRGTQINSDDGTHKSIHHTRAQSSLGRWRTKEEKRRKGRLVHPSIYLSICPSIPHMSHMCPMVYSTELDVGLWVGWNRSTIVPRTAVTRKQTNSSMYLSQATLMPNNATSYAMPCCPVSVSASYSYTLLFVCVSVCVPSLSRHISSLFSLLSSLFFSSSLLLASLSPFFPPASLSV